VPYLGVSGVGLQGVGGSAEGPIMASVLTVLLLLGEYRIKLEHVPSRVIAPGGAVTIRCPCEARRLFLYKDGIEIQELDAAGGGGQFTIPSARREDGGAYTCRSRSTSEPPNWSDPSDILIYPKPSISLRPSGRVTLGRAVTIQCRDRHQNAMFLLYKDGNLNALQDVEPAGNLAEFSIRNVSRRDAGSYSCYYHDKRYQFTWSYPSDPVELVVAGEGNSDPTPSNIPSQITTHTYLLIRVVISSMVFITIQILTGFHAPFRAYVPPSHPPFWLALSAILKKCVCVFD
uniref:Ig-like domain-containing protein n=1 Tax=Gopherus agassizii TaxID=38772 RepID=A0A452J298_9SAUR